MNRYWQASWILSRGTVSLLHPIRRTNARSCGPGTPESRIPRKRPFRLAISSPTIVFDDVVHTGLPAGHAQSRCISCRMDMNRALFRRNHGPGVRSIQPSVTQHDAFEVTIQHQLFEPYDRRIRHGIKRCLLGIWQCPGHIGKSNALRNDACRTRGDGGINQIFCADFTNPCIVRPRGSHRFCRELLGKIGQLMNNHIRFRRTCNPHQRFAIKHINDFRMYSKLFQASCFFR